MLVACQAKWNCFQQCHESRWCAINVVMVEWYILNPLHRFSNYIPRSILYVYVCNLRESIIIVGPLWVLVSYNNITQHLTTGNILPFSYEKKMKVARYVYLFSSWSWNEVCTVLRSLVIKNPKYLLYYMQPHSIFVIHPKIWIY